MAGEACLVSSRLLPLRFLQPFLCPLLQPAVLSLPPQLSLQTDSVDQSSDNSAAATNNDIPSAVILREVEVAMDYSYRPSPLDLGI